MCLDWENINEPDFTQVNTSSLISPLSVQVKVLFVKFNAAFYFTWLVQVCNYPMSVPLHKQLIDKNLKNVDQWDWFVGFYWSRRLCFKLVHEIHRVSSFSFYCVILLSLHKSINLYCYIIYVFNMSLHLLDMYFYCRCLLVLCRFVF